MTKLDAEDIAQLTGIISAAGLDRSRWQDFVDRLHHMTGARVHIAGLDVRTGLDLGIICAGYDPDWLKSYEDHYGALNAWMDGIAQQRVGAVYNVNDLCPREDLERTEFYNDWIRPQEDILGGGASMLFQKQSRMFVLGGNLRRRDIDRLEDNWLRVARILTPHLMNALEVNRLLAGKSLETYALGVNGGDRPTAVLAINADRQILFANGPSEALLECGETVRQDFHGRLSFCGSSGEPFQKALSAFGQSRVFPPQTFEILGSGLIPRFHCRICAIEPDELDFSPLGLLQSTGESALLITLAPVSSDAVVAQRLSAQYRLSPKECKIALNIASGASVRAIADENRTSVNTVRNQLRSAMVKLGVNKQIDLTRIVEHTRILTF